LGRFGRLTSSRSDVGKSLGAKMNN
jgi:hypothetical protein